MTVDEFNALGLTTDDLLLIKYYDPLTSNGESYMIRTSVGFFKGLDHIQGEDGPLPGDNRWDYHEFYWQEIDFHDHCEKCAIGNIISIDVLEIKNAKANT